MLIGVVVVVVVVDLLSSVWGVVLKPRLMIIPDECGGVGMEVWGLGGRVGEQYQDHMSGSGLIHPHPKRVEVLRTL